MIIMKAVISVIGKDKVGILAMVSNACAKANVNITDVTQTILQENFVMMMMVEFSEHSVPMAQFAKELSELGTQNGLEIRVMHEGIFQAMHRI